MRLYHRAGTYLPDPEDLIEDLPDVDEECPSSDTRTSKEESSQQDRPHEQSMLRSWSDEGL